MSHINLNEDQIRLIGVTALGLRLTQMELCEEDPRAREAKLSEQVSSALKEIPTSDRDEFLEALAGQFPTWEDPADSYAFTEPVEPDAESLLKSLSSAGEKLSEAQRKDLLLRLHKAWKIEQAAAPQQQQLPEALGNNLRAKVGLAVGDPVDLTRVAESFTHLAEFVQVLETLGYKIWRSLNPAVPPRNRPIKSAIARHLKGDSMVSTAEELLELRGLVAALLGAIPEVGGRFHSDFLWRFSPTDIEEAVRVEGGSAFTSQEAKCWRRFSKMATELDERQTVTKIGQVFVKIIEPCLTSGKRRQA